MSKVSLQINGHSYDFTCDDGQEAHLREMAELVNRRVRDLAQGVGAVGEVRLLVMTALLLADELSDAYAQLEGRQAVVDHDNEAHMAQLAGRLELLASRLLQA